MKSTRTLPWLVLLLAIFSGSLLASESDEALILRGREVYISEGCIHCHSQYIRPGTADVERWGPAKSPATALAAEPPLLGNRRLGPDLANVGNRRSPEWNRLHLMNPRALLPASRMPAYGHLFRGENSPGEALVAYLTDLGSDTTSQRLALAEAWRPAASTAGSGREKYQQLCATCHGATGHGDGRLASQLSLAPADFTQAHWRRVQDDDPEIDLKLARIVKFGLLGTPMAGHEYLDDATVVALVREVRYLHAARRPPHP